MRGQVAGGGGGKQIKSLKATGIQRGAGFTTASLYLEAYVCRVV